MMMLWVCLAGGFGAVARFLLESRINSRFSAPVPLGTLVINVVGSQSCGILTESQGSAGNRILRWLHDFQHGVSGDLAHRV